MVQNVEGLPRLRVLIIVYGWPLSIPWGRECLRSARAQAWGIEVDARVVLSGV